VVHGLFKKTMLKRVQMSTDKNAGDDARKANESRVSATDGVYSEESKTNYRVGSWGPNVADIGNHHHLLDIRQISLVSLLLPS